MTLFKIKGKPTFKRALWVLTYPWGYGRRQVNKCKAYLINWMRHFEGNHALSIELVKDIADDIYLIDVTDPLTDKVVLTIDMSQQQMKDLLDQKFSSCKLRGHL